MDVALQDVLFTTKLRRDSIQISIGDNIQMLSYGVRALSVTAK